MIIRTLLLALSLHLLCPQAAVSQLDETDLSRLPKETIAILRLSNAKAFFKRGLQTELAQALNNTPSRKLAEYGLRSLQETEDVQELMIDEQQSLIDLFIDVIQESPAELVVSRLNGEVCWKLECELDWQHPALRELMRHIANDQGWGFLKFATSKDDGNKTFEITSIGVFVQQVGRKTYLYSSKSSLANWNQPLQKTIADSRKFLAVAKVCEFSSLDDGEGWFYLDLASIMQLSLATAGEKRMAAETGISDLLALGGKVKFPNDESSLDWEVDMYLRQGMPKIGLNKLFKLKQLPAAPNVPFLCDTYLYSRLDLAAFVQAANQLENAFSSDNSNAQFSERLVELMPILGVVFFVKDKQLIEKTFQGELEAFWTSEKTTNINRTRSITRLRHLESVDENTILDSLIAQHPEFKALSRQTHESIPFLTWPNGLAEQLNQQNRQRYPELDFQIEPIAITAFRGYTWFFSRTSDFTKVVSQNNDRPLDDNGLKRVWRTACEFDHPGAFVYLRNGHWYSPFFYTLYRRHMGSKDWAQQRIKNYQLDDFERTFREKTIQTLEDWDFESFADGFGPAGVGLYDYQGGMRMRAFQLKKRDADQ